MKNLIIAVTLIFFIEFSVNAQQDRKDARLEAAVTYTAFNLPYPRLVDSYKIPFQALGLGANFHFYFGPHFGTRYTAVFGNNYFEFSPGIIGIPFLILSLKSNQDDEGEINDENNGGGWIWLFLLATAIENPEAHFALSDKLELSPSISFLRMKYMFKPQPVESDEIISFSGSLGLTLEYFKTRNLTFSAYVEGSVVYTNYYPIGINAGITMGYTFRSKDQDSNSDKASL